MLRSDAVPKSIRKRAVSTFPSARIAPQANGLPVEVSLIAQLGAGAGNQLYYGVIARQKAHTEFVDQLDEPSAKLGGTDFAKGDATSLYTFAVGANGHPFHRHAGHRVFTAISGSGGAQLRFSTATPEQLEQDPELFFTFLRYVNIPADCLFTVRFGGETWHQFVPQTSKGLHPTFFALSCHTDELGGNLSEALREKVLANEATIPALTELLPKSVLDLMEEIPTNHRSIPTTTLSLDAAPGSLQHRLCKSTRCASGLLRGAWGKWRESFGFLLESGSRHAVLELAKPPADSLLLKQLPDLKVHHEDTFSLTISDAGLRAKGARAVLGELLQGFLENRPTGVGRLMGFRNLLVRPLGLRTSPLGCPVSSLLSTERDCLFEGRFPVLDQASSANNRRAQVVLGADDKHLRFRSCVGVEVLNGGQIRFTIGTRVHCKNAFGRAYMAMIDGVHRAYIVPSMLRMAVGYIVGEAGREEELVGAGV